MSVRSWRRILIGMLLCGASAAISGSAFAVGACECDGCKLAGGAVVQTWSYNAGEYYNAKGRGAVVKEIEIEKLENQVDGEAADKAAAAAKNAGALCAKPCMPEHIATHHGAPGSSNTSGGSIIVRSPWSVTGSCVKKAALLVDPKGAKAGNNTGLVRPQPGNGGASTLVEPGRGTKATTRPGNDRNPAALTLPGGQ